MSQKVQSELLNMTVETKGKFAQPQTTKDVTTQ